MSIKHITHILGQQSLLALSLATTVAAFGCTTDRTLGNGDLNDRSGVRMAPTGGVTSGSETAPPMPPPMTSSYAQPTTSSNGVRTMKRLTADEAALIMVQQRPTVRVLGPVNPALSGNAYYSANVVSGQWQNPAMRTNPQSTINSSLTSNPNEAIANGTVATAATDAAAAALTANAISANMTANAGTSAAMFPQTSPTGAAAVTLPATTLVPTTRTPTNASMTATRAQAAATPVRIVNSGQNVTVTNQQR